MPAYSTYFDKELMGFLQSGDELAFTELYDRYWKTLFTQAFSRLKDHSLAEEIVHDIFLDIWTRRESLDIHSSLGAYLAVACKYRVINAQVRRNKTPVSFLEDVDHTDIADDTLHNHLQFEELKDQLALYVSALPERCRLAYRLSREEGLSQKDIARAMNVSEKAVEHQITRALRILRLSLRQLFFLF